MKTISLTRRETQCLRGLTRQMSRERIAATLGISLKTVDWHLQNLYAKLDAAGCKDAVRRARVRGLAGGSK